MNKTMIEKAQVDDIDTDATSFTAMDCYSLSDSCIDTVIL